MRPLLFLVLAMSAPALRSESDVRAFRSGPDVVPLLELFTSEGCSSCPPAEKWLGGQRHQPGLWRDFVPIAWHVNYWDRLGWPDRFATKAYTDRQYALAHAWGTRRVYTPETVRGGVEWSWRDGRALGQASRPSAGGLLEVHVIAGSVEIEYAALSALGDEALEVHVALLGGGIVSDVKRGENRGRQLEHEFVALAWKTAPLAGGRGELPLPVAPAEVATSRIGLAVWVSRRGDPVPLQATGGWL